MTLPYLARLACLCLASFYLVHLALGLLLSALSGPTVALARRGSPRTSAGALLLLRVLPTGLALFLVACLCAPSYLALEPRMAQEDIGAVCRAAALLGVTVWSLSLARAARATFRSLRHIRQCRQASHQLHSDAWVLDSAVPYVMLTGLLKPRIVISRRVVEALSPAQLRAVCRHERAHGRSRDNLKRLLLLLTPDLLPFVNCLSRLEKAWSRTAEWVADDVAAAGNPRRSLVLADALVRVARLGAPPPLPALTIGLTGDDLELAARVERLLHVVPAARAPRREPLLAVSGALLLAGALCAIIAQPSTLHSAHELLEFLIQ